MPIILSLSATWPLLLTTRRGLLTTPTGIRTLAIGITATTGIAPAFVIVPLLAPTVTTVDDIHRILTVKDALQFLGREDALGDVLVQIDHPIDDIGIDRCGILLRIDARVARTCPPLALLLDVDVVAILELQEVGILPGDEIHHAVVDRLREPKELGLIIVFVPVQHLRQPAAAGFHLRRRCHLLLVLALLDGQLDVLADRALFVLAQRLGTVDEALGTRADLVVHLVPDVERLLRVERWQDAAQVHAILECVPVATPT